MLEVNDYHLIFNLNGVLIVTREGKLKLSMVLKLGLKDFLLACVIFKIMYIWSSAMRRNFLRHLEIIAKKTNVCFPSFRIVNKSLYLRNDHFLLEKPDKLVFHKNLFDFFVRFPIMTFENTLLIDDMPHKSLFNPPFSAIFFETFYGSQNDSNYLFETILPYLESLHSSKMEV